MTLRMFPDPSEETAPDLRRASPTSVLTVSSSVKVAVGLGLPVSFFAFFSPLIFPHKYYSVPSEIGLVCASACSLVAFLFCWSAVFAYFIRKYNLAPTACKYAGWPFLLAAIPMFTGYFLVSARYGALAAILVFFAKPAADACRKLAYPIVHPKQPYDSNLGPAGIL